MSDAPVLVTGGSGFVAGHVVLELLRQDRTVRASLRSLGREAEVRASLLAAEPGARLDRLSFVEADLTRDDGWAAAVAGVDHVLHVASPVHLERVKDELDVIGPAREGTLRVLRAARAAEVRRVVLTSAFHAVGFGHGPVDRVFTEDDWTPLDGPGVDAYGRSKVLSERAAWDFVRTEGRELELTTLLPVAVMGPVIGEAVSGANQIILRSLNGQIPGYPDLALPIVDVRDVATAHVAALTARGAAGQRILMAGDDPAVAMRDIGALLRRHLGPAAKRVPTRSIPDVVVRLLARVNPEFRSVAADLGYVKRVSAARARELLGVHPRPWQEAVTAAADSMVARSLVRS